MGLFTASLRKATQKQTRILAFWGGWGWRDSGLVVNYLIDSGKGWPRAGQHLLLELSHVGLTRTVFPTTQNTAKERLLERIVAGNYL